MRNASEPSAGPGGEGLTTWSADRITLHGTAPAVAAGVDGEPVALPLPLTCEIIEMPARAGATQLEAGLTAALTRHGTYG